MVMAGPAMRGLRVGPYELLSRIAAGGMGEVFIARRTGLASFEKRVALKLLLPHLSEEPALVERFLEEARIAARMEHPHVVQLFDAGEADGRYYLAMALVEGVSLSQLLRACRREGRQLPLPVVRAVATGLCEALDYAHQLRGPAGEDFRVVHRDVSPSNVMVSARGSVLLGDFGIARVLSSAATRSSRPWGKYAYMPPEQLDATMPLDARADVFAAAVTLYQAFTLSSPFQRATDAATMDAIRHETLPDAMLLRPDLTERIRDTLQQGASRERDSRLPSARALLAGLMDGPVASPAELGALVESLCAAELAVFRPAALTSGTRPTRTGPPVQEAANDGARGVAPLPVKAELRPSRRARRRVLALAGSVAVGGLALGLWSRFSQEADGELAPPASSTAASRIPHEGGAASPVPAPTAPLSHLHESGAASPAPVSTGSLPPPPDAQARDLAPLNPSSPQPASGDDRGRSRATGAPGRRGLARAEAPQPLSGTGFLTVDARPWAVISVDGREVDRTPLARYPLPAGRHSVVFHNPVLGRTEQRTVHIEPGGVVTLRVDFEAAR
ncbi:protein kinase domain-containing protein [Pyxidicoccus xibeiensis]|uniref:protein kinase domain-containing protein n=1 Tax=Pyxidicoccus xibeiensis TaxID=2906759 RepID=UPI0020A7BA58|nr:protein kinase [Pyxidicoccus xibeiensis]MCP3138306.1 protein kinase [Pyxidicoccus xibeiensis]